jgi:hypothetical protein
MLNYGQPTGFCIDPFENKNRERDCFNPFSCQVTTVGFEPTRPYEHHPLKMASLPFLHVAIKVKKVK